MRQDGKQIRLRLGFLVNGGATDPASGFPSPNTAASCAEGGIAAPVKPSFDPAAWYFIDRTGTVSIIIRAGMGQQSGSAITRSLADGF